ncbi:12037_t:CDS:2, partial [Racocetra persica]
SSDSNNENSDDLADSSDNDNPDDPDEEYEPIAGPSNFPNKAYHTRSCTKRVPSLFTNLNIDDTEIIETFANTEIFLQCLLEPEEPENQEEE